MTSRNSTTAATSTTTASSTTSTASSSNAATAGGSAMAVALWFCWLIVAALAVSDGGGDAVAPLVVRVRTVGGEVIAQALGADRPTWRPGAAPAPGGGPPGGGPHGGAPNGAAGGQVPGGAAEESGASAAGRDAGAVWLEFHKADGTHVSVRADFMLGVKVFKVLVLGEMERGQDQYRTSCFITQLHAREILSPESVSKLRQRNSAVVRGAGERRPPETLRMELPVSLSNETRRGARLHAACADAWDAVYSDADTVRALNRGSWPPILTTLAHLSLPSSLPAPSLPPSPPPPNRCRDSRSVPSPCVCRCAVCVEWLPCGLRKCRVARQQGRPRDGGAAPAPPGQAPAAGSDVRTCGVRACSKCWSFEFVVPSRNLCLWGDDGA